jgi:hypothetical protein
VVKKLPALLEPEDSLPCSQEPVSGLYSEPLHALPPYFKHPF